jgi:uncharacterized protein (DUF1499 family)
VNGRKAAKARARRLSLPGLGLALVTALAAALAGLGHRWGLWDFGTGFTILRWAAYLGAAAAAMSACVWVYALLSRSASGLLLTGLAIALARFVALLAARDRAGARSDYGGQSVAAQQLRAYPRLGSVTHTLAPDQAFERALSAARDLGWSIVAAVPDEGRIEASDRSFWFGFTDDVVIRIRGHENGSLIDIRSVSRVGISDLGVNAARIQAFTEKLVDGPEGR